MTLAILNDAIHALNEEIDRLNAYNDLAKLAERVYNLSCETEDQEEGETLVSATAIIEEIDLRIQERKTTIATTIGYLEDIINLN